jgi:hypothetical protein
MAQVKYVRAMLVGLRVVRERMNPVLTGVIAGAAPLTAAWPREVSPVSDKGMYRLLADRLYLP